ncbi:MAG: 23S rRNA (uridine(2552)-2'-O)-methyltransferase [Halobacteriales archaeon]|nr:23S rRNA (uridine(2552)-2'-O)-methyltransferase [Halobacteriales archaeon]
MAHKDEYYNRAKQEGYRSRAAYKLQQLDEEATLLQRGRTVVDLGAAPGGWLQVAKERVRGGTVLGVDRNRIDDLDGVETLRGDITDPDTQNAIKDRVGSVDVVLSDMAPNMTGEYSVDHARSVHLARMALEVARSVLTGGGDFAVKVFDGPDVAALRADLENEFDHVRAIHPEASRDASSEVYLVGKRFLTAPVRAGDEVAVEITDVGDEGDGIAKVDGFALFIPDVEVGESLTVRVEEVKPRFGFAHRLETDQ